MSNTPQNPSNGFMTDLIPPGKRKIAYALFGLVGFLLGALVVAYASINQELPPTWLIVATAVYNFSVPFFSALAGGNVSSEGE